MSPLHVLAACWIGGAVWYVAAHLIAWAVPALSWLPRVVGLGVLFASLAFVGLGMAVAVAAHLREWRQQGEPERSCAREARR